MCHGPFYYRGIFWRRVPRTVIRLKRLHTFAANRYCDSQTPGAAKFWHAFMVACTKTEWTDEFNRELWDAVFKREKNQ